MIITQNDILYIEEKIPLFGARLEFLPSVKLRNNNVVPKLVNFDKKLLEKFNFFNFLTRFAFECFEWMKNSLKTEGIFRKAGSFLKQKEISVGMVLKILSWVVHKIPSSPT